MGVKQSCRSIVSFLLKILCKLLIKLESWNLLSKFSIILLVDPQSGKALKHINFLQ